MHRSSEEIPIVNVFCGASAAEAKVNRREARIGKGASFTRADKSPNESALQHLGALSPCRDGRHQLHKPGHQSRNSPVSA
jgi:hypothetical protein